ncbi:MAG TPA: efflux RND transporter periplasmic adaptor subunit [Anaerolineales bacterium]|nr:efflux RND transporter periplasmic adaptor subunit [Anaerolineales bacterium]
MKNITKIWVISIMLFAMALTACANQQTTPQPVEQNIAAPADVVAEGKIKPIRAVHLFFQARGTVEEIQVQIGDHVKKGDVLARLANADVAEAQLAAAKFELLQAQQALDTLQRTGASNLASAWQAYMDAQKVRAEAERAWERLNLEDIENRIEDAEAEVRDREKDLQDAQDEFDKYKDLSEDNPRRQTAEDDLEQAQEEYNEAVRQLEAIRHERDIVRAALDAALAAEAEAKYQYEISSEGVNKDQLALAEARLENAKAQVAAAEANLANYVLSAPFDGVVMEVAIEVGEQVGPESRAVSIADTSSWIIETTDITELEVVKIEVGQNVTFTADALPEVIMNGVVMDISQASFVHGGDVIYTVRIATDAVDPRVKWGMTVEVTFEAPE